MKCICGYVGEFGSVGPTGARETLLCPKCGCSSRHRAVGAAFMMLQPLPCRVYQVGLDALTPILRRTCEVLVSEYEPRAGLVQQNLERLSLPDKAFDVVICSDVLEHVRCYRSALVEMCRVLRCPGRLYLTVPIMPSLTGHMEFCEVSPDGPEKDVWADDAPVHEDPMTQQGCRVYRYYHERLLYRDMLLAGFDTVASHPADEPCLGIVGCPVIIGVKHQ